MKYQYETHRIYAEDEQGNLLAEITFPERTEGIYVIDHTFVDDSLRGQGIASRLVQMAVDTIRSRGGQAEATCSYAKKWMEKH